MHAELKISGSAEDRRLQFKHYFNLYADLELCIWQWLVANCAFLVIIRIQFLLRKIAMNLEFRNTGGSALHIEAEFNQ